MILIRALFISLTHSCMPGAKDNGDSQCRESEAGLFYEIIVLIHSRISMMIVMMGAWEMENWRTGQRGEIAKWVRN